MPNIKSSPLPGLTPKRIQDEREFMRRARSNRAVAQRTITIFPGNNVQKAIDALNISGGGRLLFQAGTYNISTNLVGHSGIVIAGENAATTTIDFSNSAANLSFAGTDIYTTGTVTSVAQGVNVTGSGTSWLANVTTSHQIFIGTRWYKIAAVVSDTSIILGEGYAGGATFPGASYRAAKVIQGVEISEITFKDSSGTGITFDDCRDAGLEDIIVTGCNKGIVFTNSSQISNNRIILPANTNNGIEFQTSGFTISAGVSVAGNGGHGMVLNGCRIMPYQSCSMSANTGDGVNITDSDTIVLEIEASSNSGQGIELVSGNKNVFIQDSLIDSNTGDGIKLTASSDNTKITIAEITNNGGYGVNIAASTCDNTIVSNNIVTDNTSGAISDSGVGSVYSGNKGTYDKRTEEATNNSGGSVALGDVVVYDVLGTYPEASNIQGHWTLNETTAAVRKDVSGNGNDLTNNSGGSGVTQDTSDKKESTASADFELDNSEYLNIADGSQTGLDITGDISMAAWIKAESLTANGVIIGKFNAGASNERSYNFLVINAGKLQATYSDDGTAGANHYLSFLTDNTVITTGTWYHVAVTFDISSETCVIYVDKVAKANTEQSGNSLGATLHNSTADFALGADFSAGTSRQFFDGKIDDAIIYNKLLTSANITSIYNAPVSVDENTNKFTTTVSAGDDKVFGMVEETIANDSEGSIQTEGFTNSLKVDGTIAINIGDFLCAHSVAGEARKAATGDMTFSYALKACASGKCTIDARLVSPRKL